MAEGMVRMSEKERERMAVLEEIKHGDLALWEGAARLGIGYRQMRRLAARYRERGADGLTHRGRGRSGSRGADPAVRREALRLVTESYEDFGPTLAAEMLAERHGISVDHETLRRWMKAGGLWKGRKAERKHRRRRPRRSRFGALVQIDGSPHAWFEGRGPSCCLMVMIDDATGVRRALLSDQETSEAAMALLRSWIGEFGIPEALYADRKNTFVEAPRAAGNPGPDPAFPGACRRLGIRIIPAYSPQAKGRVERSNRVFQDRLVRELRLTGISAIPEANAWIAGWIGGHSRRFEVAATDPVSAHRVAGNLDLDAVFVWEHHRVVNNDNTVRFDNRWLQLEPGVPGLRPGVRVSVIRRMDRSLHVEHEGKPAAFRMLPAQPEPAQPPPRPARPRKSVRPAPGHPWRGRGPAREPDAGLRGDGNEFSSHPMKLEDAESAFLVRTGGSPSGGADVALRQSAAPEVIPRAGRKEQAPPQGTIRKKTV